MKFTSRTVLCLLACFVALNAQTTFAPKHVISDLADSGYSVIAADVDGDGDPAGYTLAVLVPPGMSPGSIMLQGFCLAPNPNNPYFTTTDAHEIRIQ